jgi:hypothetical protein
MHSGPREAKESPRGQGSIAMLENLLPFWRGNLFVLLLGFAQVGVASGVVAAGPTLHTVAYGVWE